VTKEQEYKKLKEDIQYPNVDVEKHSLLNKQFNVVLNHPKVGVVTLSYGQYCGSWMYWYSKTNSMYHGKKSVVKNIIKEVKKNKLFIREYVLI